MCPHFSPLASPAFGRRSRGGEKCSTGRGSRWQARHCPAESVFFGASLSLSPARRSGEVKSTVETRL